MFNVIEGCACIRIIRLSPISGRGTRHERRRNSDESAAHYVRKLQHPTRMAVRWVVSRRRGGRSRRAADWSDAPTYRSPSEETAAGEAHRAHAAHRSVATLRENAKGRKERRTREARARKGDARRRDASGHGRGRGHGRLGCEGVTMPRCTTLAISTSGWDEERFHVALARSEV